MIELHYYPGNASLLPHMMLREIGCPFELRLVDRQAGAQKSEAYLKLNPNGKIPLLVADGEAIFETAAIGLYLADRFPAGGTGGAPWRRQNRWFSGPPAGSSGGHGGGRIRPGPWVRRAG